MNVFQQKIKTLRKSNRELRAERDRFKKLLKNASLMLQGEKLAVQKLQKVRRKQMLEMAKDLFKNNVAIADET